MSFDRRDKNLNNHKHSSVSAEDLKLAEFILTKPEDRLKRKGSTDANSRIGHDDAIDSDYEESEEEIAMIMKKGSIDKIYFQIAL